jgi:hypothetical protein
VAVNVDFDGGPGAHNAWGDDADAGGADVMDDSGQLGIPLRQECGFSFGADRFFGEVILRFHKGKIGGKAGKL